VFALRDRQVLDLVGGDHDLHQDQQGDEQEDRRRSTEASAGHAKRR
jgi:hypothetical protein